jgi:toxin-antitoxin system PIN domain toxin
MFLLDANVLIYAFRRDSPFHDPCYAWLRTALAGDEPVATTGLVELAFLRITTLPSLGKAASPPGDAFEFLNALRRNPMAVRIEPGRTHDEILARLCAQFRLRGNDINDAYLAALALEHDAALVTADQDFRRFPDLPLIDPISSSQR